MVKVVKSERGQMVLQNGAQNLSYILPKGYPEESFHLKSAELQNFECKLDLGGFHFLQFPNKASPLDNVLHCSHYIKCNDVTFLQFSFGKSLIVLGSRNHSTVDNTMEPPQRPFEVQLWRLVYCTNGLLQDRMLQVPFWRHTYFLDHFLLISGLSVQNQNLQPHCFE